MSTPYRILVVGPSWVGDMVMAQSLFMALKKSHKNCSIDVLAPEWSLAIMARMPEVRKAIVMPLGHGQFDFKGRKALGKNLQDEQYDQSIVLPNSWKSALTPYFANIPKRTGYLGEMRWGLLNDPRALDKKFLTKTVQRFVALAAEPCAILPEIPQPRLLIDPASVEVVKGGFNIEDAEGKVLGLCPGAEYGPAKRWPEEHYAAVAKEAITKGWQVYLFGSVKDEPVTATINKIAGGECRDFAGKTSLTEALDLMSLCDAVVSNDSGLMHVAAALNIKTIAIYGSSDPNFTPPLHPEAEVITLGLECSPCFKRECPLTHLDCLTKISPERVVALLDIA
ncbi:lipopolysaccharide heptosyltransferase II [uncultured Cycloclasticus sp.]|uniref:lipopolysaccharide heptosyltransferase II n=1 Tax=uncultured Cycloclasticus sp. TaxID=172194 RepID=UPI0025830B09|nr:lipopolysaccharide heptosyltransferase II [uncultured Cycloclasticus sp.]